MSVAAQRVPRRVAVLVSMVVMLATVVGCDVESGRLAGPEDELTTLPVPANIPPVPLPSDIPPVPLPSAVPNVHMPSEIPRVELPAEVPPVGLPAEIPQVPLPSAIPPLPFRSLYTQAATPLTRPELLGCPPIGRH